MPDEPAVTLRPRPRPVLRVVDPVLRRLLDEPADPTSGAVRATER